MYSHSHTCYLLTFTVWGPDYTRQTWLITWLLWCFPHANTFCWVEKSYPVYVSSRSSACERLIQLDHPFNVVFWLKFHWNIFAMADEPALVQVMVWYWAIDNPLSESLLVLCSLIAYPWYGAHDQKPSWWCPPPETWQPLPFTRQKIEYG